MPIPVVTSNSQFPPSRDTVAIFDGEHSNEPINFPIRPISSPTTTESSVSRIQAVLHDGSQPALYVEVYDSTDSYVGRFEDVGLSDELAGSLRSVLERFGSLSEPKPDLRKLIQETYAAYHLSFATYGEYHGAAPQNDHPRFRQPHFFANNTVLFPKDEKVELYTEWSSFKDFLETGELRLKVAAVCGPAVSQWYFYTEIVDDPKHGPRAVGFIQCCRNEGTDSVEEFRREISHGCDGSRKRSVDELLKHVASLLDSFPEKGSKEFCAECSALVATSTGSPVSKAEIPGFPITTPLGALITMSLRGAELIATIAHGDDEYDQRVEFRSSGNAAERLLAEVTVLAPKLNSRSHRDHNDAIAQISRVAQRYSMLPGTPSDPLLWSIAKDSEYSWKIARQESTTDPASAKFFAVKLLGGVELLRLHRTYGDARHRVLWSTITIAADRNFVSIHLHNNDPIDRFGLTTTFDRRNEGSEFELLRDLKAITDAFSLPDPRKQYRSVWKAFREILDERGEAFELDDDGVTREIAQTPAALDRTFVSMLEGVRLVEQSARDSGFAKLFRSVPVAREGRSPIRRVRISVTETVKLGVWVSKDGIEAVDLYGAPKKKAACAFRFTTPVKGTPGEVVPFIKSLTEDADHLKRHKILKRNDVMGSRLFQELARISRDWIELDKTRHDDAVEPS